MIHPQAPTPTGRIGVGTWNTEAEFKDIKVTAPDGKVLFESDFSDATVVTLYLTPNVLERLLPSLLALKPGTRIASYSFRLPGWEPEQQVDSFGDGSVFLWTVPAKTAGTWTFRKANGSDSFQVELEQTFQALGGHAGSSRVVGTVLGAQLNFGFIQGTEKIRVTLAKKP